MKLKIKMLLLSLLAASVINAGAVLLCEFVIKSVLAEVVAATVISTAWVVFAVTVCRKKNDNSGSEE